MSLNIIVTFGMPDSPNCEERNRHRTKNWRNKNIFISCDCDHMFTKIMCVNLKTILRAKNSSEILRLCLVVACSFYLFKSPEDFI